MMIDREKTVEMLAERIAMYQQFGESVVTIGWKLADDILTMLTEQEVISWINVKDRLPNENGSYLVVYKAFQYAFVGVRQFAKDLYSIDKHKFPKKHRPGWYEYDDEYGYNERNNITHWMPLPNLPEECQ